MNLFSKLKETVVSVLPIMFIVLVLGLTVVPLQGILIAKFIVGGILLIIGLTVFLLGVEIGIQPIGERSGAALTSKKSLSLLLIVSFIIGFFVTVAEPDIQVFGDQIRSIFTSVNKTHVVFMVAAGVGIFITLGLLRTVLHLSLKLTLLICYIIVFVVVQFAPTEFVGVAFDSGGATTGPMTVPFILALGVGVSSVRISRKHSDEEQSDSFGLTGITSIGPILAVLLYGILLANFGNLNAVEQSAAVASSTEGLKIFIQSVPHFAKEATFSIMPLAFLLVVFQIFLLKMPPYQVGRMAAGLVWSFIGLTIFLVGVNGGFMPVGKELGIILGTKAAEFGGAWSGLLICTGLVLGAVVVCAEPAVWVLTEQVESISGGTIKRRFMLVFLSIGAAVAIGLAMWRALSGFNLMYILIPGYSIALLLMIFCPNLFTAIAFDSGGVASGPITSTFVLSFTLGASQACSGNSDAFGVISLVAMTPLIAIQILGIIYTLKQKVHKTEALKDGNI